MKLFGTDGIRGRAGEPPLDPATVGRLGQLLGEILRRRTPVPCAVLGGDTRESTAGIASEFGSALVAAGVRVHYAGVVPTPAVASLVREIGADAGIAISASHNPWPDNGIKIFGADGRKWSDAGEAEIEENLPATPAIRPNATEILSSDPSLADRYVNSLLQTRVALSGLLTVLDCANGAALDVGPRAFSRAGGSVRALFNSPDGRNINESCGALHPESLANAVREGGAEFGAAFDGDADRVVACAENGRLCDGDDILWILARAEQEAGRLDPPVVVGTVLSNFGLEAGLSARGIRLERTPVGDRHVTRRMEETGAWLGGEPSGHIVLRRFTTTGDGILTALVLADLVVRSGRPLSALADLSRVPQISRNVVVARRIPLDEVAVLSREVAAAQISLAGTGRVLLRYSGTEPLLRIMVEGIDAALVETLADRIEAAAERELGAES